MKYKYVHKPIFKIFIVILIALFGFLIAYYASRWFGLFDSVSKSLPFEISISAFSLFFAFVLFSILFLSYKIKNDKITLRVFFIDTFQGQLKASMIYKLVWSKRDNKLIVCYTDKKMQQRIAFINIASKNYDCFVSDLKKTNPKIIYEVNE